MENKNRLTRQQELFAVEIAKGKTQREAYQKAYPSSKKWTDNAVDVEACRLVANTKVSLRIDELRAKVSKKLEDDLILEVKDIIGFHAKVLKSDIKDYLSFGSVAKVEYDDEGNKEIVHELGVVMKESSEVDGKIIKKVTLNNNGGFAFELYDKMDSAKEMARIMGMYEDKAKVYFPDPIKVESTSKLTDEQLDQIESILKGKQ